MLIAEVPPCQSRFGHGAQLPTPGRSRRLSMALQNGPHAYGTHPDSTRWTPPEQPTQPIRGRGRRPKPKRRFPPEVLSQPEVEALMAACSGGPAGIRNRAMIAVLY